MTQKVKKILFVLIPALLVCILFTASVFLYSRGYTVRDLRYLIPKPAKTLTQITYFRYTYTSGSYAFSGSSYEAKLEDGRTMITITRDGSDREYLFEEGPEFMDRLTALANEYQLSRWDGFERRDRNVLDGSSFSLSLTTDSDQSVQASGYMSYPKNYRAATGPVEALFVEVYEATYPNRRKLLQKYVDQVLIPESGFVSDEEGKVEVSEQYLATLGPEGETNYYSREIPELTEGILGYTITGLLHGWEGPSEVYEEQELLVYELGREEDCWQVSVAYYGFDENLQVILKDRQVIDGNLFMNDGIFSKLARGSHEGQTILIYSGQQWAKGADPTQTCFLSIYCLTSEGIEEAGDAMVTEAYDREAWTTDLIAPLKKLAEDNGLAYECQDWDRRPDDAILDLMNCDMTIHTRSNMTEKSKAGGESFYNTLLQTENGQAVGDFAITGTILTKTYPY